MRDERVDPIQLERVGGHVHAGSLAHPGAPEGPVPDRDDRGSPSELRISVRAIAGLLVAEIVPVTVLVGLVVLFGNPTLAVLAAGAILVGDVLHRLAGRVPFGFGDGWVGFRSEAGWPRGVQEDDDFHWSWSKKTPARR